MALREKGLSRRRRKIKNKNGKNGCYHNENVAKGGNKMKWKLTEKRFETTTSVTCIMGKGLAWEKVEFFKRKEKTKQKKTKNEKTKKNKIKI